MASRPQGVSIKRLKARDMKGWFEFIRVWQGTGCKSWTKIQFIESWTSHGTSFF
jgi:hypothetical protein